MMMACESGPVATSSLLSVASSTRLWEIEDLHGRRIGEPIEPSDHDYGFETRYLTDSVGNSFIAVLVDHKNFRAGVTHPMY